MRNDKSIWGKAVRFWDEPLFDKFNRLGTLYYKLKGALVYRLVFKKFGKGSYIRRPLLIGHPKFITIGRSVSVRDGARLEAIQDNKNRIPDLHIGNGTSIEQNVHIVCHSRIRIGENVAISANCCILDVTHPYEDVHDPVKIVARIRDDDSFVEIGDGSLIGFGAVVLPNVRIGKCVVVGSNAVVRCDIPEYSVAVGSPAKIVRRYDWAMEKWVSVRSDSVEAVRF
jgi:acetyltransferase-like isoleucine patch superfamily enzyme